MATLEKIRSKAGIIIVVVIGLALFAFVMQDLLTSGQSIFRSTDDKVGEIAGEKISYDEYLNKINEITENNKLMYGRESTDEKMTEQYREQAWQELINEKVLFKEFEKVGIAVSSTELADLFLGKEPHFRVRQIFTNPQTGEFMSQAIQNFFKASDENPDGEHMKVRLMLEKEVSNYRAMAKYNNLITKGVTAPKFMGQNDFIENNKKVDFNYVAQAYTTIPDKDVKITSSDLKEYYKEHKYLYEQNASRDVEYISFDIIPSASDKATSEEWISKIKPEFAAATEVELFVNQNSDVQYVDKNYKKGELTDSLDAFMFKASVGDVFGPYFENGSYKLAKLYKNVSMPDSVKARHILIRPESAQEVTSAKALADSIKGVLEKDKTAFAALAQKFSEDPGSAAKGGDLGWFKEGAMVPEFNDAAFGAKVNEIKVVESQFGIHIIQVQDKSAETKKVKVAIIEKKLEPSQRTYDQIFADANRFASQNRNTQQFNAAVSKQSLSKKIAPGITENDKSLPGLEQARELVKWAYKSEKGDVSEPLDLGGRFVVATLVQVKEKGIADLEQVRSDVELAVRKIKKGEAIAQKINTVKAGQTIQGLALKLNSPVETAIEITFSSFQLPGAGIEPKIIAAATNLAKDKISDPIPGNNGVYVLIVTNITTPPAENPAETVKRLNNTIVSRASYDAYGALIKAADIEDKHMRFF